MSRVVDDLVEPIAISKIAGRYLLFDVNAVTYLRRKHNICGVLIGTIPQAPQQNIFQGLPIQILPEEVKLLVEREVAYIVDDVALHKNWLASAPSIDKGLYKDLLRAEGHKAQRNAEALARLKSERALKKVSHKQDTHAFPPTGRAVDLASGSTANTGFSPIAISSIQTTSSPRLLTTRSYAVTPTTTGLELSERQASIQTLDSPSSASYPLFAHLHAHSYFITPGLRFGCDFTVYPGDPLRFHSHFMANGYGWEENIPVIDLIGGGRLGTGVKKGFLIGGEQSAVESSNGSVRTFSIEWGGINPITKACVEYAPPVVETKAVRQIDFNAVGEATNLKPPAARMRYTRLRRQIEGRTLIGIHGASFFGVAERTVDTRQKRKKSWKDEEEHNIERPLRTLDIKAEPVKFMAVDEHAPGNFEMPNDGDSEDDKPLAKVRSGINVRPDALVDRPSALVRRNRTSPSLTISSPQMYSLAQPVQTRFEIREDDIAQAKAPWAAPVERLPQYQNHRVLQSSQCDMLNPVSCIPDYTKIEANVTDRFNLENAEGFYGPVYFENVKYIKPESQLLN